MRHTGLFLSQAPTLLLLCWLLLFGQIGRAQPVFQNPSFEGTPASGLAPPGWFICTGSPDIQPGFWGTTQTPSDGNTYLGFHHQESVSANFAGGLGSCSQMSFNMDISIVPLNLPGNNYWNDNNQGVNDGYICIYGGYSSCDNTELLWQSPLITNVLNWQTFQVDINPSQNYTYLNIVPCVNGFGTYTYFGIDNIQVIDQTPLVDPLTDQNLCVGDNVVIDLTGGFSANATFQWSGPNGFTSTDEDINIASAALTHSGQYTVVVTDNGCQSEPVSVQVTVSSCAFTINEYTPVTAFNPCDNSVSVGNAAPFAAGDRALIIQMKGATVDLTNSAAFGNVIDVENAGNYEFVDITQVNGNSIQFANALVNDYTVSGLVQLITVPQYTDFNVTGTLSCQPWDGLVGGVLVFEASGTVTLSGSIDVSDSGFRAGTSSINAPHVCDQQDYFYPNNSTFGGRKGEGICILPNTHIMGRGKNANGGGGGNDTNAGGAGGGNYGTGGRGGNQWSGCPNIPIGGDGGLALPYNSGLLNRAFLGGGGGGGHQNNGVATPGSSGGGLAIIRAADMNANGGSIRSSALDAGPSTGDGSGGGGAGGTILLDVNTVVGNLTIDISGGDGGDNNGHGPGGGGAGGLVFSANPLGGNVNVVLNGGQAGIHSNSGTPHGAGNGGNGGVLSGLTINESTTPWLPLQSPTIVFDSPCATDDLVLDGLSNATMPLTYDWTGPNGFIANGQSVTVASITQAGSGVYALQITDTLGCIETADTLITVLPSYSTTEQVSICDGETFTLHGGGTATITGTYTDTLQTIYGCDSIFITELTVLPTFANTITAAICSGESYTLPSGTSVQAEDTYIDSLQAVNGCDSVITTELTVNPVPVITVPISICTGQTYLAEGAAQNQTGLYYDTLATAAGCDSIVITDLTVLPPIVHTIDTMVCLGDSVLTGGSWKTIAGTYNDSLVTSTGCDSLVVTNLSNFAQPLPAIAVANSCIDDPLIVSDASTIASGSITSWAWDFGNGNTSNLEQPPAQDFPSAGMYSISLAVWSNEGCVDSTEEIVQIYPLPMVFFTFDSVCHGTAIQFTDQSVGFGGFALTQWAWDFSDGQVSNLQNPLMVFADPGLYNGTLTVTNSVGCKEDTTLGDAQVYPNPVAAIGPLAGHCLNEELSIMDASTIDAQWGDQIIDWNWQLEPQVSSTDQHPTHIFSTSGIHTISLEVTSNNGCVDMTSAQVEVYDRPTPVFSLSKYEGCEPLDVQYTDESTVGSPYAVSSWNWQLGNGTSSATNNPFAQHVYGGADGITPDTLEVKLSVATEQGCGSVDTAVASFVVFPKAGAGFQSDPNQTDMVNPTISFTDMSTVNVTQRTWLFGDGLTSNATDPVYTYVDTGLYTVSLNVSTDYGCTDVTYDEILIYPHFSFYIPNTFTPNSNGVNDLFRGIGEGYDEYSMYIYNRWGQEIYHGKGDAAGWDGTYLGAPVEVAVYVYKMDVIDWEGNDHHFRGRVQVLR